MRAAGIKEGTMAKKRRKRKYARKGTKRSRAAKRAYKKSGLYKYNLKRKRKGHGKRKRRHGKRRKSHSRKRRHGKRRGHGRRRAGGLSTKAQAVFVALIARGRTPKQARKVAARLDRMRRGKIRRYFESEAAKQAAAKDAPWGY